MNREILAAAIKLMLNEDPVCLDRAVAEFEANGNCEVCFRFDAGEDTAMTMVKSVDHAERIAELEAENSKLEHQYFLAANGR